MKRRSHSAFLNSGVAVVLLAGANLLTTSCATNRNDTVYAITGTTVGVQIHEKEQDKTPEVKIGYNRAELAIVPTDRGTNGCAAGSARNSAEVLMEINAQGSLALGSVYQGGIYQRLAVGQTAVQQPGAAFMMAKDQSGNLDSNTATQVANAFVATARFQSPVQKTLQSLLDEVAARADRDALLDKAAGSLPAEFKKQYDEVKAKRSSQRAFEVAMDGYLADEPGSGPKHTELTKALRTALQ